jgi:hypothetical protein
VRFHLQSILFMLEVSGFELPNELGESSQMRGNITIGTRLPHHVRLQVNSNASKGVTSHMLLLIIQPYHFRTHNSVANRTFRRDFNTGLLLF